MSTDKVVLIVDDDHDVLSVIEILFRTRTDMRVIGASDFGTGSQWLASIPIDLLVTDVFLHDTDDGVALAYAALQQHPNIALVLISAEPSVSLDTYPRRAVCLQKPFGAEELFTAIDEARTRARRHREPSAKGPSPISSAHHTE